MTGRAYMSQEETKKRLDVSLYLDGGTDYLEFNIEGKIHKLDINSEDNQEDIKKMFCDLVPLLEVSELELSLLVDKDYDNVLLREVSSSYIKDLNTELDNVRASLLEENSADEYGF